MPQKGKPAGGFPDRERRGAERLHRAACALFAALAFALSLSACGSEEEPPENAMPVYYINTAETKTEIHYCEVFAESQPEMIGELLVQLSQTPARFEYKAPLDMGFAVNGFAVEDGRMTLDLSAEYASLAATTEVLVRAAIVRTLSQVGGVRYITFTVQGEPLLDATGQPVGRMNADTFISNDGNEINTYEEARIKLYFASEDGTRLVGAYREKFYSTSMPIERFVVEELIAGPSGQIAGLYPTINPETKVVSISTRDEICYVNLNSDFLTPAGNVSTEVAVYSIVNSLADLGNISKVQILVDGEVPAVLASSAYSLNEELVTTLEEIAREEQGQEGAQEAQP